MSNKQSHSRWAAFVLGIGLQFLWLAMSANARPASSAYSTDQILVQPRAGIGSAAFAKFQVTEKAQVLRQFNGKDGLQLVRVPKGRTVAGLIAEYQRSGLVEFAEPDFAIHASATLPNDPKFLDGTLWALNNYGQNGGTAGADIEAPAAWDVLTSASNIVVAVIDSGIRYTHEDLAANMWVNPRDGGHGWNAIATNNLPLDDNGHGTLVAGVLGAVGNNDKGVTGVAWSVRMMACKCLDSTGNGNVSDLITCIDYARTNGAKIINASLDSPSFSLALSNAIISTRDAGIIFVASAGNGNPGTDDDLNPTYPACYKIDNIVSVAYSTRNDGLGNLSNFGATNIMLAAPGDQIYSTYNSSDSAYYPPFSFYNIAGTSFAAPEVSGALALMLAKFPTENYQQIIARLLNATDPLPSLTGKCVTGGRLNLFKALSPPINLVMLSVSTGEPLQLRVAAGPNRLCVIEASANLTDWLPVFTNTTSANGTFDFTNNLPPLVAGEFFRAASTP